MAATLAVVAGAAAMESTTVSERARGRRRATLWVAALAATGGWLAWEPGRPPSLAAVSVVGGPADGATLALAFSPDGGLIASAGERLLLRPSGGGPARRLRAETGPEPPRDGDDGMLTLSVAFSPDGRLLASGDHDGTVRLWDVPSGRESVALPGHGGRRVLALAFSPDGRRLASAGDDRAVRLWDLERRGELGALSWPALDTVVLLMPRPSHYVLGFRDGGRTLAAAEFRTRMTVCLWDVESGEGRIVVGGLHDAWPFQFSPGSDRLLVAVPNALGLRDTATGRPGVALAPPRPGSWGGQGAAFSPDGRRLAAPWVSPVPPWVVRRLGVRSDLVSPMGYGSVLRKGVGIHDTATGQLRAFLSDQMVAAYAPSGEVLATSDGRGTITLWDAAERSER